MITNSYSASCYVDSKDGQYHMECEMDYDNKKIHSKYDGKNFVDGLNSIMDDITAQMLEPKSELTQEESLEDKVASLEKTVAKLQAENNDLNDYINDLEDYVNDLENYKLEETEEDYEPKKEEPKTYNIDEAIKQFNNILDEFTQNKKNYNNLYKNWKVTSEPAVLHWPYF